MGRRGPRQRAGGECGARDGVAVGARLRVIQERANLVSYFRAQDSFNPVGAFVKQRGVQAKDVVKQTLSEPMPADDVQGALLAPRGQSHLAFTEVNPASGRKQVERGTAL